MNDNQVTTLRIKTKNVQLIEWIHGYPIININGIEFACGEQKDRVDGTLDAVFIDDRFLFETIARCKVISEGES